MSSRYSNPVNVLLVGDLSQTQVLFDALVTALELAGPVAVDKVGALTTARAPDSGVVLIFPSSPESQLSVMCIAEVILCVVEYSNNPETVKIGTRDKLVLGFTFGAKAAAIVTVPPPGVPSVEFDAWVTLMRDCVSDTLLKRVGFGRNGHLLFGDPVDAAVTSLVRWMTTNALPRRLTGKVPGIEAEVHSIIEVDKGQVTAALVLRNDTLRVGSEVSLFPSTEDVKLRVVDMSPDEVCAPAVCRATLEVVGGGTPSLSLGSSLLEVGPPWGRASDFKAQLIVMPCGPSSTPHSLHTNDVLTFHFGASFFACRVAELQSRIDRRTGRVTEANPVDLNVGDAGIVVFECLEPAWMEDYLTRGLGRGALLAGNSDNSFDVVAVAVIKSVTLTQAPLDLKMAIPESVPAPPMPTDVKTDSGDGTGAGAGTGTGVEAEAGAGAGTEPGGDMARSVGDHFSAVSTSDALCTLLNDLRNELTGDVTAGTRFLDVASLDRAKMIQYANETREADPSIWSPTVARTYGETLRALIVRRPSS